VVEFNPSKFKSEAELKVKGHLYNKNVSGELHFEYLLDKSGNFLQEMKINSMLLKLDPLKTGIGTFTDIVISLLAPVTATCRIKQGKYPPWATPCDWYDIPKEEFLTSISAREGGGALIYVARNQLPLVIGIQHKSRHFEIKGGPLSTQVGYNGKSTRLDVEIDLSGHFLNFAPTAVGGKESTRLVECSSGRNRISSNQDPAVLDAGGSFEVYNDPIPSNAYKWYEDYGLVTRKYWGSGNRVTIGAHEISYGVHHMTLLVRDDFGVADTDSFELEIQDTKPPQLTVPPDISYLIQPPQKPPVKINLGQAWATDLCADETSITNDAPKDMLFPVGVTTVTWEADDGRGNVVTKPQRVNVYRSGKSVLEPRPGPFEEVPTTPAPALPGKASWCEQFSAMSILHSAENRLKGCGFTGGRWRSDHDTHYKWCMNVPKDQAEAVSNQRQHALQHSCQVAQQPQPWQPPSPIEPPQPEQPQQLPQPPPAAHSRCQQYAQSAVAQNQQNLSRGCGFSGLRWSSDYNGHYQWCLSMPQLIADLENGARENELMNSCRGAQPPQASPPTPPPPQPPPSAWPPPQPPPQPPQPPAGDQERCQQYARSAVAQNQQNLSRRCGFSGSRWSADHNFHYRWCLGVPRSSTDSEYNARENDLRNRCMTSPGRVM
jgi:hypothetical protein